MLMITKRMSLIRLRTRSGTQVMIDETTGFVYVNSKNGNSWLEVSDAGVDIYTANSVSIRAEKNLNIRAENDIILDAGSSINLRAGKFITMEFGDDTSAKVGNNFYLSAKANSSVKTGQQFDLHAGDKVDVASGANLNLKSGGKLQLESAGDTSLRADGKQARDGSGIFDNSGLSTRADAAQTSDALVPNSRATLDTKKVSGEWTSSGGKVNTIVSRMPTHEPWEGHPNSKVSTSTSRKRRAQ